MRTRFGRAAALIVLLAAAVTTRPQAQTPAPGGAAPFDIVGFIDAATLNPEADGFSGGGTITVNGTPIIVPKNTLLQMPAFALTWQEVFTMAPAPWGPAQSGLARTDTPAPATTYEVHIQGNRLGSGGSEQYIAGLMFISQQSLNAGAGFINYIDYGTGELYVGGQITTPPSKSTGARVVMNDPAGKFGRARTPDARFTIDEDNPTVRAETAYPMCVPRTDPASQDDPLCPQVNRPTGGDGNYLTVFTMDPLPWDGSAPTGTNPLMMAPFEVGDYVNYSGSLVNDGNGPYVSASSVIGNVGIYTAPYSQPAYVAIDVMVLGVGGIPDPNLPQEAAVRTRIEGFSTDPTAPVDLYAIDVDPCTGTESWRYYDTVGVDPGPAAGGAVAGRWRWRPNQEATYLPPTRNLLAVSWVGEYYDWTTGQPGTPAGLRAGRYSAPNFTFLFPENLAIGNPPVPSNFQDFPFLAAGSGPYYGAVPNAGGTPLGGLGQLSPWPGAAAPVKPVCTAGGAVYAPVADAGLFQSVRVNDKVVLDASASHDTNSPRRALSYTWTLVDGPRDSVTNALVPVTLANVAGQPSRRTFNAPEFFDALTRQHKIPLPYTLKFQVTVDNGATSSAAVVSIDVSNVLIAPDTITITLAQFRTVRSRLDVTAVTSDPTAVLTLQGFGQMSPGPIAVPGVPPAPGSFTMAIVGVNPQPTRVTVVSSKGGSATATVTVR
jgi:hypothetical protein